MPQPSNKPNSSQQYAQLQPFVQKEIDTAIQAALKDQLKNFQYQLTSSTNHAHKGGGDSPQINPQNLLPMTILTAVPTYAAPDGTWAFVYNSGKNDIFIYVVRAGVWTNLGYTQL